MQSARRRVLDPQPPDAIDDGDENRRSRGHDEAQAAHGWEQNGCDRVVDDGCNKVETNTPGVRVHSSSSLV